MAKPTKTDLQALSFSLDGSPKCNIATKTGINLDSLQYSLDGSPFWGISDVATSLKIFVGATGISKMFLGSQPVTFDFLGNIEI